MIRINHYLLRLLAPLSLLALSPIAYAASGNSLCAQTNNLCALLQDVIDFIDVYVVPLVFALAFIIFIIGIFRTFIAGATNEEKRQEGQKLLLYGLIGFFIMFSVWGLINLLVSTFGFDNSTRPDYPTFNGGSSGSNSNSQNSPFGNASGSKAECTSDTDCGGEPCIAGKCDSTGLQGTTGASKSPTPPDTTTPPF